MTMQEETVPDDTANAKASRVLDRRLDKAERHLPEMFGAWLAHLRHPSASWLRVPLGVLLVIGGLLGILAEAIDLPRRRQSTPAVTVRLKCA